MIGGGEEPFQRRGAAVAEMHVGDQEETSWPERRMHFVRSWKVRLAHVMGLVRLQGWLIFQLDAERKEIKKVFQ